MNAKVVGLIVAGIAVLALGIFGGLRWERANCDEELARASTRHGEEMTAAKAEAERWADTIATRQGEAMLRAFVSGVTPAVLADRIDSLGISSTSLLRVPGVAGIHLFRADGQVIYSSDAKLTTLGVGGDRATWALAAPELVSRKSDRPGMLEFALPIVDSGKVLALCWMEYDVAGVREAGRGAVPAAPAPNEPGS